MKRTTLGTSGKNALKHLSDLSEMFLKYVNSDQQSIFIGKKTKLLQSLFEGIITVNPVVGKRENTRFYFFHSKNFRH